MKIVFILCDNFILIEKDNAKKTGTGGGKDKKLDEVDLAILKIIDEDSAAVKGLNMPQSDVISDDEDMLPLDRIVDSNVNTIQPEEFVTLHESATSSSNAPEKRKRPESLSLGSIASAPTKRRSLENSSIHYHLKEELIRLEIYNKRLKSLKLEQELGISLSGYTKPLFE